MIRLNALLVAEDATFREEFFEVVIAIFHLLKGVRRQGGGDPVKASELLKSRQWRDILILKGWPD